MNQVSNSIRTLMVFNFQNKLELNNIMPTKKLKNLNTKKRTFKQRFINPLSPKSPKKKEKRPDFTNYTCTSPIENGVEPLSPDEFSPTHGDDNRPTSPLSPSSYDELSPSSGDELFPLDFLSDSGLSPTSDSIAQVIDELFFGIEKKHCTECTSNGENVSQLSPLEHECQENKNPHLPDENKSDSISSDDVPSADSLDNQISSEEKDLYKICFLDKSDADDPEMKDTDEEIDRKCVQKKVKRVRFNANTTVIPSYDCLLNQHCMWEVPVLHVDIKPGEGDEEYKCDIIESFTIMICHHPSCMEKSDDQPLLLCSTCDQAIHQNPDNKGHLVLDIPEKVPDRSLARHESTPAVIVHPSEHDDIQENDGDTDEDVVDGYFIKKHESELLNKRETRSREEKLKRKKAMKCRRYNSEAQSHDRRHSVVTAYGNREYNRRYSDQEDSGSLSDTNLDNISIKNDRKTSLTSQKSNSSINSDLSDNFGDKPPRSPLRKQSKVSVGEECFVLLFESSSSNETEDTEIVRAQKGVSLKESLITILERRKIDLINVHVYVQASHTPLPMNCDTFLLGGNTLIIKEKGVDSPPPKPPSRPNSANKASSGSKDKTAKTSVMPGRRDSHGRMQMLEAPIARQRRNSLSLPFFSKHEDLRISDDQVGSLKGGRRVTNLSIDETTLWPSISPHGTLSAAEGRRVKSQSKLTNLFNPPSKDREKHEQLNDILNGYANNGLPPLPDLLKVGQPSFDDTMFETESHWSSIVDNASKLSKREHDQQEAIWELLQTEITYIKSLRVITDLFMCVLVNLQSESLLNEIETEKLFNNILDITSSSCQFWQEHLLKLLKTARESHEPLCPSHMKNGFKKFNEVLRPYTKYCLEQRACVDYMKSRYNDNDLFKTFIVWAEAQKQCNRLKLTDLLVKPMQRMTKYSLLLQAVLRKTDKERQRCELLEMIGSVDKAVSQVNGSMREQHEQEKLASIAKKIEPYDAIEAPYDECLKIVQEYNTNFDLTAPMPGCKFNHTRALMLHTGLKLKETPQTSKIDVDCFLFTDLFLVCKASKRMDKYKILKPPMRIDRLIVQELRDKGSFLIIHLNEYHVPAAAFTFHSDPMGIKVWLEKFRHSQDTYKELRKAAQQSEKNEKSEEDEIIPCAPVRMLGTEELTSPDVAPCKRSISLDSSEGKYIPNITIELESDSNKSPNQDNKQTRGRTQSEKLNGTVLSEDGEDEVLQMVSPNPTKSHKQITSSHSVPPVNNGDSDDEFLNNYDTYSNMSSVADLPANLVDENTKAKLNQRRSSRNEKRYYTADAIQELNRKDKDNSIYKRLSWNMGTMDPGIDDKSGSLKGKCQSIDSIRSYHSSSGFSSSGSIHLSPDSEILEDIESCDTSVHGDDNADMSEDRHRSNDNSLTPDIKQSKSMSTSDLSVLMQDLSTSHPQDGIGSVELPKTDPRKKLNHAQLMKMKKQLLLSSTIEASEV